MQWLRLHSSTGRWIGILIRELISCMLHGLVKQTNQATIKNKTEHPTTTKTQTKPNPPNRISFLFRLGVHPWLPQHLSPHLWLQDDGGPSTLSVFCCVVGERKRPRSALSWLVNPPAVSAHSPSAPPSDIPRADAGSVCGVGSG